MQLIMSRMHNGCMDALCMHNSKNTDARDAEEMQMVAASIMRPGDLARLLDQVILSPIFKLEPNCQCHSSPAVVIEIG